MYDFLMYNFICLQMFASKGWSFVEYNIKLWETKQQQQQQQNKIQFHILNRTSQFTVEKMEPSNKQKNK